MSDRAGGTRRKRGVPGEARGEAAWTPQQRTQLVMQILRGEASLECLARRHDVPAEQAQRWRERFVRAGEDALRLSEGVSPYARIRELERKLGEMALEMDRLRKSLHAAEPAQEIEGAGQGPAAGGGGGEAEEDPPQQDSEPATRACPR